MKNSRSLKVVLSVAALLFGAAALLPGVGETVFAAVQEEMDATLVGQLSVDDAGGYILVEKESGDSIALHGPAELADYVGGTVKVSGRWVEAADGTYFEVSSIETA